MKTKHRVKAQEVKEATKERRDKAFALAVGFLSRFPHSEQYIVPLARIRRTLYRTARWQSSLEVIVAAEFMRQGVQLRPQYRVNGHRTDFAIPRMNFVLEVDGTLFHSEPEAVARDYEQSNEMLRGGWTVYRLKEQDIMQDLPGTVRAAIEALWAKQSHFDGISRANRELSQEARACLRTMDSGRPGEYLMKWDADSNLFSGRYSQAPVLCEPPDTYRLRAPIKKT